MARLTIKNLVKRFGDFTAINNLSIEIKDGEFITLLGPSGCGKTTTLRSIAGFIEPDEGSIYFDDKRVNDIPPNKRPTAMVFQSYALFPHMTVYGNVSFGLRMKKVDKKEADSRIKRALELVSLTGLEQRYPKELSGGQQQRVAVARALVMQPEIILFDEPLSNLDAKLRERMRIEIRELQKKLGITAIYVTHDQAEALVISDRVAVMEHGVIRQIGKPTEVYNKPNCPFVADFIGIANFINGNVREIIQDGVYKLDTEIGTICLESDIALEKGKDIMMSIRPEDIYFEEREVNCFKAQIKTRTYMGNSIDYHLKIGERIIRVQTTGKELYDEGSAIFISFKPENCTVVDIKDVVNR